MKRTQIEVPAVAWWVLLGLLIPPLQAWIEQTFPGQAFPWATLLTATLGAVLKWLGWVMEQNGQDAPPGADDDVTPAQMAAVGGDDGLDWRRGRRFDPVEFLFGVKRA